MSGYDTFTCWADPLSRKERVALAEKLARACGASWRVREEWASDPDQEQKVRRYVSTSVDMADLHMDVTERAEATA